MQPGCQEEAISSFSFNPPGTIHLLLKCLLNLFTLSRSLFPILLIVYPTFCINFISDLMATAARKIKSISYLPGLCGPGVVRKAYGFKGDNLRHFLPRTRCQKVKNSGKIVRFSKSQGRRICDLPSMSNLVIRPSTRPQALFTHQRPGKGNQSPETGLY